MIRILRMQRTSTLLLAALALAQCSTAAPVTDGTPSPDSQRNTVEKSGAYCGVSCLYVLLRLAGRGTHYQDLLRGDYIGSWRGSTIGELTAAAKTHGMYTKPVGNLTCKDLAALPYPVILHVKAHAESREYDHYMLFLGMEKRLARVFDPPGSVRLITPAELAPLWDGNGLVVCPHPIDLRGLMNVQRMRLASYAALVALLVLVARLVYKKWSPVDLFESAERRLGLSLGQVVVLVLSSLVLAFLCHFLTEGGFLTCAHASEMIQRGHAGSFIRKIGLRKMEELSRGNVVLVDARFTHTYNAGHLQGAKSIPVNATDRERHIAMRNVGPETCVVVYCQSADCPFAERVAVRLRDDGFRDVSVYRGGWAEWSYRYPQEKGSSS